MTVHTFAAKCDWIKHAGASLNADEFSMAQKPGVTTADGWFVYILRCADGSLYTGITTDVDRRVQQHNAGNASRYTRSRLPVRLAYQEPAASRSSALKREWAIKSMARSEKDLLSRANGIIAACVN